MTPFDPGALLAILLTFYQPASPSNLARAYRERPEYFGGGAIIGTHGDALRLPDGTVWDLIFAVDGPEPAAYQAIHPGASSDAGGDPLFALAPGALTPAPPDVLPLVRAGDVFQPIVADAIADLAQHDATLAAQYARLVDADSLTPAIDGAGGDVDGADQALGEELGALDAAVPADIVDNTDQHSATIPGHEADYDDPAPGYVDTSTYGAPPPYDSDTKEPGGAKDVPAPPP